MGDSPKEEETEILEMNFRECHKYHQEKKKYKTPYKISNWEYYVGNTCRFLFREKLKRKREIYDKSLNITDYYMDIINIIRKFMEFDFIKKVLMTDPQRVLMKYQYQHLNVNNHDKTVEYLDSFLDKLKLKENIYDDEETKHDVDLKMVDGFLKYYNY